MPTANADYWTTKIGRNKQRDVETDRLLLAAGWAVVRIWEHEKPEAAARLVADLVRQR